MIDIIGWLGAERRAERQGNGERSHLAAAIVLRGSAAVNFFQQATLVEMPLNRDPLARQSIARRAVAQANGSDQSTGVDLTERRRRGKAVRRSSVGADTPSWHVVADGPQRPLQRLKVHPGDGTGIPQSRFVAKRRIKYPARSVRLRPRDRKIAV